MKTKMFWRTARLVSLLLGLLALFAPTAMPTAHTASKPMLADLPPAAQALVSANLGRADARYQFQATNLGYALGNASNYWWADFSDTGISIQSENSRWTMALHSIGYGKDVQAVNQVAPTANANRLEYTRDAMTEWFVNGPAGLEQGWTLNAPPTSRNGDAVTLTLAVNGRARMNAHGDALELLRDDGTLALRYSGLYAYDATGRELRAWMETGETLNAPRTFLHIHVDDTDARYPLTIDPYLTPNTLTSSSGAPSDQLGTSVAVSADGSTIVAGAYGVNAFKGAAYVFVKSGSWATTSTPTATLTNSGGAGNDSLGYAVSVNSDGSVIVAGAYGANSSTGAAYVYAKPGGGWATTGTPTATLTKSGGASGDSFGVAVAISSDGSTIVIGENAVNAYTGAAHVYAKPGGGWATTSSPTATLTNSGGMSNDQLGYFVAVSSDGATVVAGANGVSSGKGAAYVYAKPGGGWATTNSPTATLTNSSGTGGDYFGIAVAISADGLTIVVGANSVNTSRGAAYVYTKPGGAWATTGSPTATLTNSSGASYDQLGTCVAVNADGSTVVAGASGVSAFKGAVYVYAKPGSGWATTGAPTVTLANSSGTGSDFLGNSVAINANTVTIVVGAPGVNSSTGAAYVYGKDPTAVTLSSFNAQLGFDLGAWLRSWFK